ncbi:MAG TPA: DMT family transporter [Pseudomonadales bacterium]|nr:DMT family transporter [Pseudomonadales bacterium]
MQKNEQLWKGIVYALLTALLTSVAIATARSVLGVISVHTVICAQYIVCLLTLVPWISRHGLSALKTQHLRLHAFRGVAGWLGFYAYYLPLPHIPLVDAVLLRNTAPIVVPIILLLWLKEQISVYTWLAILLGFSGVAEVLTPDTAAVSQWHFVGFLSGVFLALSMVSTRQLTRSEPANRIIFYYFFISLLCSLPFAIIDWHPIPTDVLLKLLFIGMTTFYVMKFYTLAYANGPPEVISPLSYFAVVFAGILGWLFWQHIPPMSFYIGAILIIAANLLGIFFHTASK